MWADFFVSFYMHAQMSHFGFCNSSFLASLFLSFDAPIGLFHISIFLFHFESSSIDQLWSPQTPNCDVTDTWSVETCNTSLYTHIHDS